MFFVLLFLFLAFIAWPITGAGTSNLEYCSSMNTGSGHLASMFDIGEPIFETSLTALDVSVYQSNGKCKKHCDNFAFAIVQNDHCWCSSLAPAGQTNTDSSKCGDQCPGYPPDPCGNTEKGLYGYIQMPMDMPTGTASVSTTMSTTTAPPVSSSHSFLQLDCSREP